MLEPRAGLYITNLPLIMDEFDADARFVNWIDDLSAKERPSVQHIVGFGGRRCEQSEDHGTNTISERKTAEDDK